MISSSQPGTASTNRRSVTRRTRRVVQPLHRLRDMRSIVFVRCAIVFSLVVLGIATVISIFTTHHLFQLQGEMKQAQHQVLQQSNLDRATRKQIAEWEATTNRDATIVQTAFYLQSSLTLVLLVLCYLYFVGDRAERKQQERKLLQANRRLALLVETDGLTELKNRRAFEDRLQEEWERFVRYGTPFSLLMIDVDHFKHYNDSHGHIAGDVALKMAAEILRRQARRNDFAARYGGEEFVVLLPHTGIGAALVTAERIRAAFIATHWPLSPVTVSVGATTVAAEITNPQQLVKQADLALYYAKHEGRNRVTHSRDAVAVAH